MCQIKNISEMGKKSLSIELKARILMFYKKINRIIEQGFFKTFRNLLSNQKQDKLNPKTKSSNRSIRHFSPGLKAGDVVKIRSKEEILKTLDEKYTMGGCGFMREMWQYCGSQHKVLKKVEYFFDERNSRYLKAHNIVLLEGLYCSGNLSKSMPNCDRMCFFFWREEWLKKID